MGCWGLTNFLRVKEWSAVKHGVEGLAAVWEIVVETKCEVVGKIKQAYSLNSSFTSKAGSWQRVKLGLASPTYRVL